jgi:CheY-like chemotaxis protein
VMLAVSDTGHGMTDEVLAKAFEPFFTTKGVGRGSGLGLAQVYGFAKQSGGGVSIRTRVGEGTTVSVYLPRAETAPALQTSDPVAESPAVPSGVTILLVDDDSAVREVTASLLREFGYGVIEAGSGNAALDLLRGGAAVDLLLADYAMPGMNGVETVREAQALRPGLRALFITGFADLAALREVGEERIIQKPFREDELARKVAAIVGAAPGAVGKVVPLRR